MEMYESGFHWNLKGDRWNLFSPAGKVCATVFLKVDVKGHNWFVWDEDGCGGENSREPTIEQAKITAESAVLRWGKHFSTSKRMER